MTVTASTARELSALGSALVYEAAGKQGVLSDTYLALDPSAAVAGPARLVACQPGDNLALHHAVAAAATGEVLVCDAGGYVGAGHWGEILTAAAQARGVAGLVIDGSVRDAQPVLARGFPVFCKGLCIVSATKSAAVQPQPPQLRLGGVSIAPGDLVVADRDGVVVVPAGEVDSVLAATREKSAREAELIAELEKGGTTLELLDLR